MNARTDQIAALYAHSARLVQRQVARRINAPAAVIEDACQTAWERLCTHPDVDPDTPGAVRWLAITAIREAWRHAGAREIPTDPRPTSPNRSATHPARSSGQSPTSTTKSCAINYAH